MCGITGFVDKKRRSAPDILDGMVSQLSHRGPDDSGTAYLETGIAQIGLGQTRLSIIDLSPGGHQPMMYQDFTIVFNGEIYNYREIKRELEKSGHSFVSSSDTEVVLHSFFEWGADCVHRFIGMFAFVIYDNSHNKLYAFRDRAGVKPFYYYHKNGLFLFASELKAMHRHPGFEKEIDNGSVRSYFDLGYVPTPQSIFKDAKKLEAGSYLVFDLHKNHLEIKNYWNAAGFYHRPKLELSYE